MDKNFKIPNHVLPKTIISDGGWGLFIIVQYNMGTKLNSIPAQDEPQTSSCAEAQAVARLRI